MIYKPETDYRVEIEEKDHFGFFAIVFPYKAQPEKLVKNILLAMGFQEDSTTHNIIFKHEANQFKLDFAREFVAALKVGQFPKSIPYVPSYVEHRTTITADKYSIAYPLLDEKTSTKDPFLVFETTEELRESVAWLYAYTKHGKDYPKRSIQVIPRAGRTEAKLLLASEENKVARIPNPFGEFGEMLKLDGLDRVPKSELKHLYRKDENLESDNQQRDIFSSQETSRKEDLAVASSQAIARKDELAVESNTQRDQITSKENPEEQGFARSQEEALKGELSVASLQEIARKSEVSNESLQKIEGDGDFKNQEKATPVNTKNNNNRIIIGRLPKYNFKEESSTNEDEKQQEIDNSFEETVKAQSPLESQTKALSGELKKIRIKQTYQFTKEFDVMEFDTWNEANHFLESYPASKSADDRIDYQIVWEHDQLSGQLLLDQSEFNPKIVSNVIGKAAYLSLLHFQYFVEGRFGDYEPNEVKELKLESKKYNQALNHYYFNVSKTLLLKEYKAKIHIVNIEVEGSMLSLYEMTNRYEGVFEAANGKLDSFAKMKEPNHTATIKATWHDRTELKIDVPYSSLPEKINRSQWILWIGEHIGSDKVYDYQTEDNQPILFDPEIDFPEPNFYFDTLLDAYWRSDEQLIHQKIRLNGATYHKHRLATELVLFLIDENLNNSEWKKRIRNSHNDFGKLINKYKEAELPSKQVVLLSNEIENARQVQSPARKNVIALLNLAMRKGKKIESLPTNKDIKKPYTPNTTNKELEVIEEEQESLNELELEDLFKDCFASLQRLLPDLQKQLERGVKEAQSVLPFGNGQEVLNFAVIDQRSESIYLLELEFRTKVSTSTAPVVIQFLIDFDERSISVNNYFNDPENPYDSQKIEQFIALLKDALEKSLEVGHQFDLASISIETQEQKDLESEKTIYYSLLAQAYWRAIDLDENQKFELPEHEHAYHLERLSVVINDYLNKNESFFSDHPSLNNAIDHPTLKNHPFKALRQLYYEEALNSDKLKRIILICKKLVPKDKAARKGIELILKSIENDSQPLVDLPLLVIKEDQAETPKTKVGRVKLNKEIEALLDKKGTESKDYTQQEIELLSQYSGYGGSKVSEINKGLLYEYYTPDELVRMMWILAREFGYNNGSVLEPSCGTGNFIRYAPIGARIEGYETNKYSATICQLLYPHATIHNKSFEKLFFNGNIYLNGNFRTEPFDLVIGNPPYGEFSGTYAGLGEKKRTKAKNYEHYFIKRGLDLLNPDGLLVYVIPNSFLANGNSYNSLKGEIALKCTIEFAFRLSSEVFKHTSIETDIIVLRKRKNRKDGE